MVAWFPVAFRPPAFACWASCSRRGVLLPVTVGLPGCLDSAHPSHDRIGCPLYPETKRCSHGRSDPSGRPPPPLPGARSYHPGPHPISGAVCYGASSRVHLRSPARPSPSPVVLGWSEDFLGLSPEIRTPAGKTCGARQGRGRAAGTATGRPTRSTPRRNATTA
jgi:hypothetical protein